MINYYLKNYAPSGTSFADGVTTGSVQSKYLSSKGIRSNFMRMSSLQPAASQVLLNPTFNAGTTYYSLGNINFGALTGNAAKVTTFQGQLCIELDCARLLAFNSLFEFTVKVSGFDSKGDPIYDERTANYGINVDFPLYNDWTAVTFRAYKFITSVAVVFTTPATNQITFFTTNAIELPTTDIQQIASYITWNDKPYYLANTYNIGVMGGEYHYAITQESAKPTNNTLPIVDLILDAPDGNKVLTVLSVNTGYGAPIEVSDEVKAYFAEYQPAYQNYDKAMIEGKKNYNDASKWRGWIS